jgi:hypothetical protein
MNEFAVESRAGDMLEMDVRRDKALPSLFDYDYAVLMKSFVSEEEKKIFHNFCTIRFHARMFAAGVVNGSLMQAPDSYILSVARVGDLTIHNEVESVQIARENFQRMPSKAYTPRLFLPVPVVEVAPVDIKTPELN